MKDLGILIPLPAALQPGPGDCVWLLGLRIGNISLAAFPLMLKILSPEWEHAVCVEKSVPG